MTLRIGSFHSSISSYPKQPNFDMANAGPTTAPTDPNDNFSDTHSDSTWGSEWTGLGIKRDNLYSQLIKPGYEAHNYLEVSSTILKIVDWQDKANQNLERRISNALDTNILPDPIFAHALSRLKTNINRFCDHHLTLLRQHVHQLRAHDPYTINLWNLVIDDNSEPDCRTTVPLTLDSTLKTSTTSKETLTACLLVLEEDQ